MELGTVFGLAGLLVALVSLVYVRTQAAASRAQALASAQQAQIAQRVAALDLCMRLNERTLDIRRELLASPAVQQAYLRANPALAAVFADVGGLDVVITLRSMLDSLQDIFLLRKEGIVNDAYWRNYIGAFEAYARMPEMRRLFDNSVERSLFEPEFRDFCAAFFQQTTPADPLRAAPVAPERRR